MIRHLLVPALAWSLTLLAFMYFVEGAVKLVQLLY